MKKLQKPVSILLSVIMLLGIFTILPLGVNAEGQEEGMSYIQRSWNGTKIMYKEMFCKDYKILDEKTDVNLTAGWYALTKSISLNKRLMINSGTVNLILCDDAELKTIYGIGVGANATLNIYAQWEGTGAITFAEKYTYEKLEETYPGYFDNAIIGGTNGASGAINIYGGTLTLKDPTEFLKGAAIGGGNLGSTGGITIYGGTIDVKSGYGAAIGGGISSPTSRESGKGLIIYGGSITAESKYGAGIGCGHGNNGKSGFIAIYKGKIQAKSTNGAAIGGGYKGNRTGKIDIYGGIIDAYSSESGAGIGTGENGDQVDEINIHGGNIYARAVRGAGIGSGACGDSYKINITGGNVTAHSYSGGAGIGAGMRSLKGVGGKQYGANANEINITDAVVEAKAFNKEVNNKFFNGMDRISESISEAIKEVDMDMSSIPAMTLSAIKLGLKFIANLADDDGECFGAGIGAGSRGGVVSINIKNSTVTANGGLQSAGIGSSKQGGIKSISIINSTVEAHGDDFGAGIGTGNEGTGTGEIRIENSKIKAFGGKNAAAIGTGNETTASSIKIVIIKCNEVKATGGECGAGIGSGNKANGISSVYINESTIEANGGEEGAGIGTGNESKTRTFNIEINYNSKITAKGGEYAAGIGGGDDVSCGTVRISGSKISATGGKDAAGIGGGEDGHGGNVYIHAYSDVYAKGNHYGAGIGGGEDADGGYCDIDNTSKVKAIAGNKGWCIAIGNGDYTFSRKIGTVKLGNKLKVKIKKVVYNATKGVSEMRISKNVEIYPCEHKNTVWKFYDGVYHVKACKSCGEQFIEEKGRHEWNSDKVCTVCGAKADLVTMKWMNWAATEKLYLQK